MSTEHSHGLRLQRLGEDDETVLAHLVTHGSRCGVVRGFESRRSRSKKIPLIEGFLALHFASTGNKAAGWKRFSKR
jgi:hypothetical protein